MRIRPDFLAPALLLTLAQCHLLTGDYRSAATGAGGGGAAGSGGTTTTTDGGVGGTEPNLVSSDLLARYFFDDAVAGETPQQAADSAATPALPLNIDYGDSGDVVWAEVAGNRGLFWPQAYRDGMLSTPIAGTKITDALTDSEQLTVELVIRLDGTLDDARLLVLGEGSGPGFFALRIHGSTELELLHTVNLTVVGQWQVPLLERHVLHLVVDTGPEAEDGRARLFVDGLLVSSADYTPIERYLPLAIAAGQLILGNDGTWKSIQGTVYYAALYGRALTAAQIDNNVGILRDDDDSPE